MPRPRPARSLAGWAGKTVLTLHDLKNGHGVLPAGSTCLVERAHGQRGLDLSCAAPRFSITHVQPRSVRVVTPMAEPPRVQLPPVAPDEGVNR